MVPSFSSKGPSVRRQALLSLAIPTYNEAANLEVLLAEIFGIMGSAGIEIIVVDDDSPDETWRLAEDYAKKDARIRVIRRRSERGLSGAVVEGFRHARGNILGVMDADLSHDPKILPEMIERIEAGADVVMGSRRVPGGGADDWPFHRRLTSNVATALARAVISVKLMDPMSGYFVLRREIFERVKDRLRPKGYKILLEIVSRAKPRRVEEVPFVFRGRTQGHSKLSPKVMMHFLEMLFDLRFGFSPIEAFRRFRTWGRS